MDTTSEQPNMRHLLATEHAWTPRQREVLDLVARGKSNQEVADALGISLDGAKWHMREILSKLGVDTREEAGEYWRRYNGWPSRFGRLVRGIVSAGAVKWVSGAAVVGFAGGGLAVVAFGMGGSEGGSTSEPAASTDTPTSSVTAGTSQPSTTPTPEAFEGTLAGIEIRRQLVDVSPLDICEGGLQPLPVPEARLAAVEPGARLSVDPSRLPAGITPSEAVAPDVFVCGDEPVSIWQTFQIAPAPAYPGGGRVFIFRDTGPPQLPAGAPREQWREVQVAGKPALVNDQSLTSQPIGECTAALWDEQAGVFTRVDATTPDGSYCEAVLRAVVE